MKTCLILSLIVVQSFALPSKGTLGTMPTEGTMGTNRQDPDYLPPTDSEDPLNDPILEIKGTWRTEGTDADEEEFLDALNGPILGTKRTWGTEGTDADEKENDSNPWG